MSGRMGRTNREIFYHYYEKMSQQPAHDDQVKALTAALERLIDREFLIGYGVRTPHKWYIKEVKLAPPGRKLARRLWGEQQSLPLKN